MIGEDCQSLLKSASEFSRKACRGTLGPNHAAEAEDIASEAVIALLGKLDSSKDPVLRPMGYLRGIVKNLALREARRRARTCHFTFDELDRLCARSDVSSLDGYTSGGSETLETGDDELLEASTKDCEDSETPRRCQKTRPDLFDLVEHEIRSLPQESATVARMVFLEGMSPSEIGNTFGVRNPVIRQRLLRARRALQERRALLLCTELGVEQGVDAWLTREDAPNRRGRDEVRDEIGNDAVQIDQQHAGDRRGIGVAAYPT